MERVQTPRVRRFLDVIHIASNGIELDHIMVKQTDKGNWAVYYRNGSKLMTVRRDLLDRKTIRDFNLEYREV
jgi:hypothetical protein